MHTEEEDKKKQDRDDVAVGVAEGYCVRDAGAIAGECRAIFVDVRELARPGE